MSSSTVLSVLLLSAFVPTQTEQKPEAKPLAITHITVIDCTGKEAQADMTVLLTGDRITALGKAKEVAVPKDARVIDGKGKFLIPGLWDMHAHWMYKPYLPLFTANGVTGIRIMWGTPHHLEWRKEVADGALPGPRMLVAGSLIDGPKPIWQGSTAAATAEEGRKAVQATKKDGYDFVKVYSLLPEEVFLAVVAEAKQLGIPFVGHVPEAVSAARASDLGQKSIEHLWGVAFACSGKEEEQRKAYLADLAKSEPRRTLFIYNRHVAMCFDSYDEKKAAALFARFVKNETWQVPTLTILRYKAYVRDRQFTEDPRLKYVPPSLRTMWDQARQRADQYTEPERVFRKEMALVGAMHKAGVRLLAGTDVSNPFCFPGFSLHDELALLVEAGLSPTDALQTATRNPAQFLGREKDLGTVEEGKLADLVLLDADPLQDIKNTRKIASVIVGGKLLTRATLDKTLAEVEAAAQVKEESKVSLNPPSAAEDQTVARWLKPQDWRRDREEPALSLGEKGSFDDQHIFAPHVIALNGEYLMYYSGSQRCVEAGTYKGVAKDPANPQKSDQRLFKLGLARSKDGVHFARHSREPVFSFGDDVHSVVTAAILKNPDGSPHREGGKLRMYFAAVDFPGGTYKHDLYETTSADGLRWAKPTLTMKNAYAPCVMKEGDKYRMWYTCIDKHPWHTKYAESADGTRWTIREQPCIVMDQPWEVKDQVYPFVLKADGVYFMLYGCYWRDDKHTALGFAVSKDGLTWTKHPDNPVFRPEPRHDWESNFTTSHALLRLPDGGFRLWYAGRKQPPWSNLYFALGTAHWKGPGK